MRAIDDPLMLTKHLPFRDDDNALRINVQADGPIGEGSWHAVAVAFQMNEAGRRHALAIFHKAVEGPGETHEACRFTFPCVRNRSRLACMGDLAPKLLATLLQPVIQGVQRRKAGHGLP